MCPICANFESPMPSSTFKPMLADNAVLERLKYPLYASAKLDGLRGVVYDGKLLSRSLKLLPNRHVQRTLAVPELEGMDGEIIVGSPTSKSVYRDTSSGVMSHDGEPDFHFYVFDVAYGLELPWEKRFQLAQHRWSKLPAHLHKIITPLEHLLVRNEKDLLDLEERTLAAGYEGLILRDPQGRYKFGRATEREGLLLKFKRFVDAEAVVVGVEEEMFNGNEAQTNELGRTKRSTAKAGLVGKGTMGALIVKDIATDVEFKIGTGFDAADRRQAWTPGEIVKYKHFPIGVKDAPRHPVYLGRRSRIDM